MIFENPIGFLAFLSLPALVALHLFQQRFRQHPTTALFLWGPVASSQIEGRRIRKPQRTFSLLMQVLAAGAVSLLVAQPRRGDAIRIPHLAVVLDGSASMSAHLADGTTPALRARAWIVTAFPEGERAVFTLVETSDKPRILAGAAARRDETLRAIDAWHPTLPGHAPHEAVRLARILAAGTEAGTPRRVVFLTDALDPALALGDDVEVRAFGEARDNAGLLEARRHRLADGSSIARVVVCAFAAAPLHRTLTWLAGDGAVLGTEPLELPPRAPVQVSIHLPEGAGTVRARLDGDALALDDEALLPPPRSRVVRIASLWEADDPAGARWARAVGAIPDAAWESAPGAEAPGAEPHILVGPASKLEHAFGTAWQVLVGNFPEGEHGDGEPLDLAGPYIPLRAHPLVQGITLDGVVWTGAHPGFRSGTPVLSAGRIALVTEEETLGTYRLRLNLDLARTNLVDSPDWPILVANLVEMRRGSLPGLARWTFRAGETVRFRIDERFVGGDLSLRTPGGVPRPVAGTDPLVLQGLREPGAYALVDPSGATIDSFAVNFHDPSESDLASRGKGSAGPEGMETPAVADPEPRRVLDQTLLLAAIAALALDGWLLSRARAATLAPAPGQGRA